MITEQVENGYGYMAVRDIEIFGDQRGKRVGDVHIKEQTQCS
jgi:hypothetical protein